MSREGAYQERSPDKRQASGGYWLEEHLGAVILVLKVRDRGALVIRTVDDPMDALVSIFTEREILFEGPIDAYPTREVRASSTNAQPVEGLIDRHPDAPETR